MALQLVIIERGVQGGFLVLEVCSYTLRPNFAVFVLCSLDHVVKFWISLINRTSSACYGMLTTSSQVPTSNTSEAQIIPPSPACHTPYVSHPLEFVATQKYEDMISRIHKVDLPVTSSTLLLLPPSKAQIRSSAPLLEYSQPMSFP